MQTVLLLCLLVGAALAQTNDDDVGVTHHWVYQTSSEIVCLFGEVLALN